MSVKQHLNGASFRFEITKLAYISVWRQTIVFFSGNLSREFHVANAYSKDREDLLAYVDNDLIGRWKFCDEEVREALKNLSIMRTSKRKGFKMLSTSSAAWREPVLLQDNRVFVHLAILVELILQRRWRGPSSQCQGGSSL